MTELSEHTRMRGPDFKWEWNINSIAITLGILASVIGWGWTLRGWDETSRELIELKTEVAVLKEKNAIIEELKFKVNTIEAVNKAQEDRMDRFADVVTLFRGSFGEVTTELKVLGNKVDTINEALKERDRRAYRERREEPTPRN